MRAFISLLLVGLAMATPILRTPILKVSEPIQDRYIVKLKKDTNLDSVADSVRLAGGRVRSQFKSVFTGFAAQLTQEQLELVSKLPGIEYIEEDGLVRTMAVASWGLDRIDDRIGQDESYNPSRTGAGVDVYVIDTGVNDLHMDFEGRAKQAYISQELAEGPNEGGGNVDCNGHGTHCSGTVGSKTYGVAKGVHIFGVKVLSCVGFGSTGSVISGVNWVHEQATKYGARRSIASMSLGGGLSQANDDAVNALADAGVSVAVAAGNSNDDACDYSPARAVKAITVGSTDPNDRRSSFSSYGACLDIFAPGRAITSTWIGGTNATSTISGTSMATPHVAGALALYSSEAELLDKATPGVLTNIMDRSPNLLLYVE